MPPVRRATAQTTNHTGWPEEVRIQRAVEAYEDGIYSSLKKAADAFEAPYQKTFQRRQGCPLSGSRGGSNRKLDASQEAALCSWLDRMIRLGFPPRKDLIQQHADRLILISSPPGSPTVGKHWVSRFLKRHPEYVVRRDNRLDAERHACHNSEEILVWFGKFAEACKGIEDGDKWNMDECGAFCGMAKSSWVVVTKEMLRAWASDPNNREWLTNIESISGDGEVIPSFIILTGKIQLLHWYQSKLPREYTLAVSDSGYSNGELSLEWLDHFDKFTARGRPRLLLVDGHDSHITDEFIERCHEKGITPFCLPPHTTHLLQPLDVGVFQPFKHYLSQAIKDSTRERLDSVSSFFSSWLPANLFSRPLIKSTTSTLFITSE
jgi:hypothetical protein